MSEGREMRKKKSKSQKRLAKINRLWPVLPFTLKAKIYLISMFYYWRWLFAQGIKWQKNGLLNSQ